jgi:nickel-dependent lactate racemase
MLSMEVPVTVNKRVLDCDRVIVCGPVFPHEVAGFSGATKYFFPGISGPEVINFTHWLGALITSMDIIGTANTPVRTMIDRAADMIPTPKLFTNMVVTHHGMAGLFVGDYKAAWQEAVALSSHYHVHYVERRFKRVLSVMPELYDDIWTAAKGMYKVEPVIEDGGEVIIYAPHIDEISYTHGKVLDEVGYHVRDYFVKQWDRFLHQPWGVLAHSTHLRGGGTYDLESGVERPRIHVTLATSIPREVCEQVNLGYMDPDTIDFDDWRDREDEGLLFLPRAGEQLYRLVES